MDPPRDYTHTLSEIRTLVRHAVSKKEKNEDLIKEHAKIKALWRGAKNSIEIERDHANAIKAKLHSNPAFRLQFDQNKDLFLVRARARDKKLKPVMINEKDIEAERDWLFLRDYAKVKKKKAEYEEKLIPLSKDVLKAEAEFNDDIDKIANKYIEIKQTPEASNPLYKEINLRMMAIRSQNYQNLEPSVLKMLDTEMQPLFDALVSDASGPKNVTACTSVLKFLDLYRVSPSYALYRLSKIVSEDAVNVAEMIIRELSGTQMLTEIIKRIVQSEIASNKTNTFFRESPATALLFANYLRYALTPALGGTILDIRKLFQDKKIELDPKRNTTNLPRDQVEMEGLTTLTLKKINQRLALVKKIPEDLKEILRLISRSRSPNTLTSLFFLKYFNPELIRNLDVQSDLHRNMMLLSKTLSLLANNEQPDSTNWMHFLAQKPSENKLSFQEKSQESIINLAHHLTKEST
jgi:hypothetical protein